MYSQEKEERYITRRFEGFVGTFLDIGAYDGITMSNTYRLAELGWRGVCVEPSPACFELLARTHGDNPRIRLVEACIGSQDEVVDFYDNAVGTATAKKSFTEGLEAKLKELHPDMVFRWTKIQVRMNTVRTLLAMFPDIETYEFVNIDAEGMDLEILQQLPLDEIGVKMVSVECHGKKRKRARRLLEEAGFTVAYKNLANLLMARD